jgi:hypothetical protein
MASRRPWVRIPSAPPNFLIAARSASASRSLWGNQSQLAQVDLRDAFCLYLGVTILTAWPEGSRPQSTQHGTETERAVVQKALELSLKPLLAGLGVQSKNCLKLDSGQHAV